MVHNKYYVVQSHCLFAIARWKSLLRWHMVFHRWYNTATKHSYEWNLWLTNGLWLVILSLPQYVL